MRLYEVIVVRDEDEKVEAYQPTNEYYRDIIAFRARVREHGSLYHGRKWILLPVGKKESKVLIIQPSHQFEILSGG